MYLGPRPLSDILQLEGGGGGATPHSFAEISTSISSFICFNALVLKQGWISRLLAIMLAYLVLKQGIEESLN